MIRHGGIKSSGFLVAAAFVPVFLSGCLGGLFEKGQPVPGAGVVQTPTKAGEQKSPGPTPPPEEQAAGQSPNKRHAMELPEGKFRQVESILPPAIPGQARPTRAFAARIPPNFTYGNAVLSEDSAWQGEVHIAGAVTVAPQATLTIEPGTVVRFGEAGEGAGSASMLLVYGRIDVRGTKDKPVLFVSRFAQPMAGDWRGIVLLGSEKKNLLSWCRIEGAETGFDASYAAVTLKNVTLSHCTTGARFRDSVVSASGGGANGCVVGMRLTDSEADLREVAFTGNRQGGVAERSSLYVTGGSYLHNDLEGLKGVDCRLKISGGEYIANGAGIDLDSSQGAVSGARIAENADFGILLAGSRVRVSGNEIVRNSGSGMKVTDGRGAAWGNAIYANGTYDLVYSGRDEFIALGNWWGSADPAAVARRISPGREGNGERGVVFLPLLNANPLSGH